MRLSKDVKDVVKLLMEYNILLPRDNTIDISELLDEDNKVDMWMFELALRYGMRFTSHATGKCKFPFIDFSNYYHKRGIDENSDQMKEETRFFIGFAHSIYRDELSPGT